MDVIQEIKADKNKKIFTLGDISKRIDGVTKKLLSNEIHKLIDDEILEVVVYEPICMVLKEDVKSEKYGGMKSIYQGVRWDRASS